VCFYVGGNPFWLMIYPQHERKILTDLEFAWHVMSAIGDAVEMAYGDADAALSMQKNVEKAIQEGNEMGDAPNQAWAGISWGDPQNMWYDPAQLTYPIIYQLIDGEYAFDVFSVDHIAFDINGMYVVQLVSVNSDSDLTGNPQLVVNVYTRDQWNAQQNPQQARTAWRSRTSQEKEVNANADFLKSIAEKLFSARIPSICGWGFLQRRATAIRGPRWI